MIGQDHVRRLTQVLSGVEVVGVNDIDLDRARSAAPEGAEVFGTPEALIRSDSVDTIVICSWGPAHEEQLLACIAAGKPVFCEKPLVTSESWRIHSRVDQDSPETLHQRGRGWNRIALLSGQGDRPRCWPEQRDPTGTAALAEWKRHGGCLPGVPSAGTSISRPAAES
jgi:hypothetical protein